MAVGTDNAHDIEVSEIRSIMTTEAGRNFMWRLLQRTGVRIDTFNPDAMVNAHRCGERSIGIWLQNELQDAAPGSYMTMIKENLEDG